MALQAAGWLHSIDFWSCSLTCPLIGSRVDLLFDSVTWPAWASEPRRSAAPLLTQAARGYGKA